MTLFLHEPQRKNEIPNGKAHCWMYLSRFVQVNLPHPPKYFINTPSASVSSLRHIVWWSFLGHDWLFSEGEPSGPWRHPSASPVAVWQGDVQATDV